MCGTPRSSSAAADGDGDGTPTSSATKIEDGRDCASANAKNARGGRKTTHNDAQDNDGSIRNDKENKSENAGNATTTATTTTTTTTTNEIRMDEYWRTDDDDDHGMNAGGERASHKEFDDKFGETWISSSDEDSREDASSLSSCDVSYDNDANKYEDDDDGAAASTTETRPEDDHVIVDEEECDVVVLGAGAAGIGAARRLLGEGGNWRVVVIEARDRAGGRAWSSDELGAGVELDHGARWTHAADPPRDDDATATAAVSFEELEWFDAGDDDDDDDDDDDGSSSSDDDDDGADSTANHGDDDADDDADSQTVDEELHPHRNDVKYRMMWNDEGCLERVAVDVPKKVNSDGTAPKSRPGANTESQYLPLKPGSIHHQAARLLYKEVRRFSGGPRSPAIDAARLALPKNATYADCLDELARRETPTGSHGTFREWLYSRAEKALEYLHNRHYSEVRPPPRPRDVRRAIARLRLQICHYYENYECSVWAGILDDISRRHDSSSGGSGADDGNAAGDARGYGRLMRTLATLGVPTIDGPSGRPRTMDIRYHQRATSVVRTSEGVLNVSTVGGGGGRAGRHRYVARIGCICALPLGVLRHDEGLDFDPPLPDELSSSLDGMSTCLMNKVEVLFPSRWWPEGTRTLEAACYALNAAPSIARGNDSKRKKSDFPSGDGSIPWTRWIVERDDPAIIVCHATGEFAERVEEMTAEEAGAQAVAALRSAFVHEGSGVASIPDPVRTHCTRWRSDPFSRGSWTVLPAGGARGGGEGEKDDDDAARCAFRKFNEENGRDLYFAGEHACDGGERGLDAGTVHGAYVSGVNAAEELIRRKEP